jgi:uncharacterized protein (AIM24 family)
MIKYEIEGGHLPVVICYPEPGQSLCTESGAMSWMSPNMRMDTNTGGGLKKMFGRMFSGESLFLNEYTAENGSGMIAFASSFPGSIIPYQVTPGNGIIVQKRGFLAMEKGLELSVYFQKKLGKGLFGGEGFIMQRICGNGMVFLEIDGHCKQYDLAAGESIIVDTGYFNIGKIFENLCECFHHGLYDKKVYALLPGVYFLQRLGIYKSLVSI